MGAMGQLRTRDHFGWLRGFLPRMALAAIAMGWAVSLLIARVSPPPSLSPAKPANAQRQSPPAPARPRTPKRSALDRRIDQILGTSEARRGFWGIEVIELPNGKLLYQRDADHLYLPASNMKMFSTAAALEKLGPDYVARTTVESDAAPDARGRVGDLYIVGRGDPNLGSRTFPYKFNGPQQPADKFLQELAGQVSARGVRDVSGTLVADDSYFLWEPFAPNWAADDLQWGYGAPVTALAFNDNSLTLHVQPGAKAGDDARVRLEPLADYYRFESRVETSAAGREKRIFLERLPGSMLLDVWGQIPADAAEETDTVAILNPPQVIAELFRRALEARGIAVEGQIEVRHFTRFAAVSLPDPSPQPPLRVVLAEHTSPPLREAIKVINKESQNLHAEMLLRTLGHAVKNYGSLTAGLEALNAFAAQQVGILAGETYFSDGSGLSREDLVAPHAVAKLLLYMARSPRFPVFFDSLPVSGIDGTLASRLAEDRVRGRIHAKTGTVEHVNSLSGYMDLPSGKRLAFSILASNHPLKDKAGPATLDAITLEIYDWFSKRR
jgi:D-alanyl-D-alanine carboxypeptidase/D-alanyl-D-alanine-endopeptidase (penicillin-binding protein 4)